ncbi:MAG: large conductance mechanosensitive channel protein MscL [Polymorphobacter sp.]
MFQEFKAFVMRGNVLDLAVAVIIGAAFGGIITSLTDDLIMPVIGLVTGGADFSSQFILLGDVPAGYTGALTDYAALKKAGAPLFGYGKFLTTVLNFLIIAFVIFQLVRAANKLVKPAEAAPAPGPTPSEALLAEIRDELKAARKA